MLSEITNQSISNQITLNGFSKINDEIVVSLSANIPNEYGMESISHYIQNSVLYEANKDQVRKDIADFTANVYRIEDELVANKKTI